MPQIFGSKQFNSQRKEELIAMASNLLQPKYNSQSLRDAMVPHAGSVEFFPMLHTCLVVLFQESGLLPEEMKRLCPQFYTLLGSYQILGFRYIFHVRARAETFVTHLRADIVMPS